MWRVSNSEKKTDEIFDSSGEFARFLYLWTKEGIHRYEYLVSLTIAVSGIDYNRGTEYLARI